MSVATALFQRFFGSPQSQVCEPGVYRLYWKSGGSSVASVGRLSYGGMWFAPANWRASGAEQIASTDWELVEKAELIEVAKKGAV